MAGKHRTGQGSHRTGQANSTTAGSIGCAGYVGRVGALAVALGIGGAITGATGIAAATPDTGSDGGSSHSSHKPPRTAKNDASPRGKKSQAPTTTGTDGAASTSSTASAGTTDADSDSDAPASTDTANTPAKTSARSIFSTDPQKALDKARASITATFDRAAERRAAIVGDAGTALDRLPTSLTDIAITPRTLDTTASRASESTAAQPDSTSFTQRLAATVNDTLTDGLQHTLTTASTLTTSPALQRSTLLANSLAPNINDDQAAGDPTPTPATTPTVTIVAGTASQAPAQPIRDILRSVLGVLGYSANANGGGNSPLQNPIGDLVWGAYRRLEVQLGNETPTARAAYELQADNAQADSSTVTAVQVTGASPDSVVSPDGTRLYVVDQLNDRVNVIDTSTGQAISIISTGDNPNYIAISPDGSRVFVSHSDGNQGAVSVIDTASNSVVGTVSGLDSAGDVAVSNDGRRLYVVEGHSVAVVDAEHLSKLSSIYIGGYPGDLLISPDDSRLYVVGRSLYIDHNRITTVDTATNARISTLEMPLGVGGATLSPDGRYLFVSVDMAKHYGDPVDQNGNPTGETVEQLTGVWVYDTTVLHQVDQYNVIIPRGDLFVTPSPTNVAVSPDGRNVYVLSTVNGTSQVTMFDRVSHAPIDTMPITVGTGGPATSMTISPNGNLYIPVNNGQTSTTPGSTWPDLGQIGSIMNDEYAWAWTMYDDFSRGVEIGSLFDSLLGEQGVFRHTLDTAGRATSRILAGVGAVTSTVDLVTGIVTNDQTKINNGIYGAGATLAGVGAGMAVVMTAPVAGGFLAVAAVLLTIASLAS